MPWFHAVAEREHELQNPTSPAKIRLLGERLRLGPESRLLDMACGKGGPALLLASEFGCHVVGVEGDAAAFTFEQGAFDAALCLGATFVWDGLDGTLEALAPAVGAGGFVAVGEPFWRAWPLPEGVDDLGYVPLRETVARLEAAGFALVTLIAASEDDWDTYESLRWRSLEEWLAEHADHPEAPLIRERHDADRDDYLRQQRALLGWAIFVGRKRR
jgi:SAM-dependent methyltransferase